MLSSKIGIFELDVKTHFLFFFTCLTGFELFAKIAEQQFVADIIPPKNAHVHACVPFGVGCLCAGIAKNFMMSRSRGWVRYDHFTLGPES